MRDHPRSRGVYYACEWINAKYGGSSPLARGLHPVQGGVTSTPRIIPARAGFTDRGPPRRDYQQDHPRSRGVYTPSREALPPHLGSSPLARGLLIEAHRDAIINRIIPARAGFTSGKFPP